MWLVVRAHSTANQTPAEPSGEPEDLVLELMTGQYAVPSWFQRDTPLPQRIEATAVFRTAAGYSYKIRTDVHDDSKPSGLFR